MHDVDGGTTTCTACRAPLVVRDWYEILDYRVTARGTCAACDAPVAGRFGAARGRFGRRRMPVVMGA